MLIITYDIANDKMRTRFSKFLNKFGFRIQYSVFKIRNSKRVLNNIILEIDAKYLPNFTLGDSIYIFNMCERCDKGVRKYGFAKNEDFELLFV